MPNLQITGGARIGLANATWPLATLSVTQDRLELNASIIGNLVFQPKDIISIETYTMLPIIGQGIKINHRIATYNRKVIFWTFKNPETLLSEIKQTGFLNNIDSHISETDLLIIKQQEGSFPIKKTVAIFAVILWNLLFLSDIIGFFFSQKKGLPIGNGITLALGLTFTASILALTSNRFSKIILKEGREIKDISKFLYLLLLVTGFMLIGILILRTVS